MAKTIATGSELETRNLVASIAERGRKGYEARDTSIKPTQDLAAAASAAVKADPVDIPSDAMASLTATTDAPAGDASRYAEAQRAIFDRGRGRESGYMGERYGAGQKRMVEGTNTALSEYGTALAEADAARKAYGSGGGPGWEFGDGVPAGTEAEAGTTFQGYEADYGAMPMPRVPEFLSGSQREAFDAAAGDEANGPAATHPGTDPNVRHGPVDRQLDHCRVRSPLGGRVPASPASSATPGRPQRGGSRAGPPNRGMIS